MMIKLSLKTKSNVFFTLPLMVLGFLLAGSTTALAQFPLQGKVQDDQGQAIAWATISLSDTAEQVILATALSDSIGHFELEVPQEGNYQISIRFLGYQTHQEILTLDRSVILPPIVLATTAEDLATVVVKAERPVLESKEDRLLFHVAASQLRSGYDGLEVLQQAPYVWVDTDDQIQIRNERAMVQINGRPINMQGSDLASLLRSIPSEDIHRIEVQSTPGAAVDANQLGGVINIVLKKKQLGLRAMIRGDIESFGERFYEVSGQTNWSYGGESWNLYGNYRFLDVYNNGQTVSTISYLQSGDFLQTELLEWRDNQRHTYRVGGVVDLAPKHNLGLEWRSTDLGHRFSNEGNLALTQSGDTLEMGQTGFTNDLDRVLKNALVNYRWTWDTLQSNIRFIGDYTLLVNEEQNEGFSEYELGVLRENQERNSFDNRSELLQLQVDVVQKWPREWQLLTGLKWTMTDRENALLAEQLLDDQWMETDRSNSLDYRESISAGYVNLQREWAAVHFAKIGLRTEATEFTRIDQGLQDTLARRYLDCFPSAFYRYRWSQGPSLSARYSRRIRRPSFRLLNNEIRRVNDFRYSIGNPDLQAEYRETYELAYNWKKHNLALYLNQSNNAINGIYFLEEGIAFYQKQNNGTQSQWGIQYSGSYQLNDWWKLRASTNLYYRKYTDETGQELFQQTTLSLRLFQTFTFNKTTSLDLNWRLLTPKADAFYEQDERYHLDLILKKSFFEEKLNCRLYVYDLFNTLVYSNTRPFDDIVTTHYHKARTRSIRLSVAYTWANRGKVKQRKNQADDSSRNRL